MKLTIVTGMSGAGKSATIRAMEDMGIYCVDNMPPKLVLKFAQLCIQAELPPSNEKVAVVVDARGKEMFPELFDVLKAMDTEGLTYKMLFLDAANSELINRYKITRRRHPLISEEYSSLSRAIDAERIMISPAKARANYVLDTTLLSGTQLKQRVAALFGGEETDFLVNCLSFGFKFGVPLDADLMFDVRCLPNPFYEEDLRAKTGLDEDVRTYVLNSQKTTGFLQRLYDFVDYMLPLYHDDESKSQLSIAIGCTGGRHRSVTIARELEKHLAVGGYKVIISHRDIDKKKL